MVHNCIPPPHDRLPEVPRDLLPIVPVNARPGLVDGALGVDDQAVEVEDQSTHPALTGGRGLRRTVARRHTDILRLLPPSGGRKRIRTRGPAWCRDTGCARLP